MLFWLLILVNLCSISTIDIGYLQYRIYTPQPLGINASYIYNYSTSCQQCLCYALTANISYSIINCMTNTLQCLFYKNFTTSYSFDSNINGSVYLFQSPPAMPMITTAATSMQSTSNSIRTSTQAAMTTVKQITSTMSPCLGLLTITFDNIINASSVQGAMPSLYNCFRWVNGWYANVSGLPLSNGYRRALVSGAYIVLNRNGTSMNMTTTTSSFDVSSFVATAAYENPLHLSLQGIRGNNTISYQQDVLVNVTSARTISLNWLNITTLNFQTYTYDSPSVQNLTGLGYQFAMDNINVTLN